MAPKQKNQKNQKTEKKSPPKQYDYSGLEEGMRVQAEYEGEYYAADVVQVSKSKSRAKAPVKVAYKKYPGEDEWVGGDRLRSKKLVVVKPEPKEKEKAERKPMEVNFGYWKIRGLGAVFRMIFEYKGVKYTDNQYATGDDWFASDKPKILEKNVLANLPYVECGNDCVCQTNACLSYLGRRLRMNGFGRNAQLLNEQLLCEVYDTRNAMVNMCYPHHKMCRDEAEFKEKAQKVIEGGPFKKFEASIAKTETDYFCGKAPCVADFHIWEMLDQHRMVAEKLSLGDVFADIPKCKAFYDRFRALPTLEKYFASDAYKLPVNSPMGNAYFL